MLIVRSKFNVTSIETGKSTKICECVLSFSGKGAFTYYVSTTRGGRGFAPVLTFAYGGGRGGSRPSLRKQRQFRQYMKSGHLMSFFSVKTSRFGMKLCLKICKFVISSRFSMERSFCDENSDF